MAARKVSKKSTRSKKAVKHTAGIAKAVKKASASVKKGAKTATKSVKAAAKNPKRTVQRAARGVHDTATRARDLGETVSRAGEIITETADFVDAVATRAATRRRKKR